MPQRRYEDEPELFFLVQSTIHRNLTYDQAVIEITLAGFKINKKKYQRIKSRIKSYDDSFECTRLVYKLSIRTVLNKLRVTNQCIKIAEEIRDKATDGNIKLRAIKMILELEAAKMYLLIKSNQRLSDGLYYWFFQKSQKSITL